MQTKLWGGPLDGIELEVPDDQVSTEMVIPQLTNYPPEYATEATEHVVFIRHHYVFDNTSRRYNYAGDWG